MFSGLNDATTVLYVVLFLFLVSGAITTFVYLANRKIFAKELERRILEIDYKRKIGAEISFAQEKERERIAKDLHDEIGNKLAVLNFNLHLLKSSETVAAEHSELISQLIYVNKSATESSRKIVHDLMPPVLENYGFEEAVRRLVNNFKNNLEIQLLFNNLDFSVAKNEYALQLYRILQELLSNTVKHSDATKVEISFFDRNKTAYCKFLDNGRGFDMNGTNKKNSFGLKNIRSRIEMLNGSYQMQTSLNNGFQIEFSFYIQ